MTLPVAELFISPSHACSLNYFSALARCLKCHQSIHKVPQAVLAYTDDTFCNAMRTYYLEDKKIF